MTEKRYFEILKEYKVRIVEHPDKEKIERLAEEQLRKQMKILEKAYSFLVGF